VSAAGCWLQRFDGRWILALAAFGIVLTLSGCGTTGPAPVYDGYGPAPDGYYRIRQGDTLHKVASRHRVSYETLARWNELSPPYRIYAGKLLLVESPGGEGRSGKSRGTRTAKTTSKSGGKGASTVKTSTATSKGVKSSTAKAASGLNWRWPLGGKVVQKYRSGDRTRQGIRIAGRPGQKVLAAEGGTVVYSGSGLKGYGNLIIVKHNNKYLSAYGFNQRLLVNEGVRVKRGQGVAEVGQAAGGEYRLHFEIRRNGTAVDPLKYLP